MDYETTNNVTNQDGGNDSASIIRGTKIKFTNNAEWITGDGELIASDREFIVMRTIKVSQKWVNGLPEETRLLQPGEPWPDTEKLNAEAPKSEWREAFGKKLGPWENARAVYLFCPRTYAGFTFPTSSTGGDRAVRELAECMQRAQMVQGPSFFPLVTLTDVHMPTQFGGRQRPHFVIKKFVQLGTPNAGAPLPAPQAAASLPAGSPEAATKPQPSDAQKPSLREELNDDLPF
jgi:hypothetical protein